MSERVKILGEEGDTEKPEEGRPRDGKNPNDVPDELAEPCEKLPATGQVLRHHLGGDAEARSSSRLLQEILDVLLPTSAALEIGGASDAPGLEEAGGVSFLKRH